MLLKLEPNKYNYDGKTSNLICELKSYISYITSKILNGEDLTEEEKRITKLASLMVYGEPESKYKNKK